MFQRCADALDHGWRHTPALFYALHILIGAALPLTKQIEILLPIPLFWLCLIASRHRPTLFLRLTLGLLLLACTAVITHQRYRWPPATSQPGTAEVHIQSIQYRTHSIGGRWHYHGTLRTFWSEPDGEPLDLHHVPCSFSLGLNEPKIPADGTYLIQARLESTAYPTVQLKQLGEWRRTGDWSLAQWRCNAKQRVHTWVADHISDPSAAAFLSGMATGQMDDPRLLSDLSRFGLQHLLAVSGLHFALLASLLAFALRSCLGERTMAPILVALLSAYALFVGDSPSVARAWVSSGALWLSLLAQRPSYGANNLGIALGALVLYKPLWVLHLGFQLSFLATGAILILSRPTDSLLQRLIRPRPLTTTTALSFIDQHGYLALQLLRRAIAITLAVHLAVAPLLATVTHQFNWLSLLYNLFFPPLIAPALWLLALAGLLSPIPFLCNALCHLNSHYTASILHLVENMPARLDCTSTFSLPLWMTLLWLLLIFTWALLPRDETPRPHWLI